ncbi:MAG: hypothetical protein AAFY34_07025, partial [Pseudomonadota bacterium]
AGTRFELRNVRHGPDNIADQKILPASPSWLCSIPMKTATPFDCRFGRYMTCHLANRISPFCRLMTEIT